MRHLLLGVLLLTGPATLLAQQSAARTWTGPADSGKRETILAGLRQTRDFAGRFAGYDIVRTQVITPHLLRIYIVMLFERQPIYAHFVAYDSGDKPETWAITTVTWHTDAKQAWPPDLWAH